MDQQTVFSSDLIRIVQKDKEFLIESYRKGIDIAAFNRILADHPFIKVTDYVAVRNAIQNPPTSLTRFGILKERVQVEISSDELRAYITLSVQDYELTGDSRTQVIKEILDSLRRCGVAHGIKQSALISQFSNNQKILIAEGDPPQNGCDSEINMYELREVKPEAKEDGNVDHYELSLINKVQKGDWLGERIDATEGTPGKSVKGNTILPLPGKVYPLIYDKDSVEEVREGSKTVLRALKSGAVHYEGPKVMVSNHLEIDGDIDFRTGNVDFDGYLTIKGTVADNFAICADRDIEITGDYGVGSVKEIVSRGGNIYIKGGVAGKNRAIIRTTKNIYTKFVSDATIICNGTVHIGFYCLNSNITAKEVIIDSPKGQIIGGNINAEIKVVSSIIGSPAEKRTSIQVTGFDRKELRNRFENVSTKVNNLRNQLFRVKQEVAIYSNTPTSILTKKQMDEYTSVKELYFKLKDTLIDLENEKKNLAGYLRTHGEGEVAILKKAYPNTVLEVKRLIKELNKEILSTVFYYSDGELKHL